MHPNGSWEHHWRFVGGTGLLGIAPSSDGSMLVCDAHKGLLRVEEERVTILASTVQGSAIRMMPSSKPASFCHLLLGSNRSARHQHSAADEPSDETLPADASLVL